MITSVFGIDGTCPVAHNHKFNLLHHLSVIIWLPIKVCGHVLHFYTISYGMCTQVASITYGMYSNGFCYSLQSICRQKAIYSPVSFIRKMLYCTGGGGSVTC